MSDDRPLDPAALAVLEAEQSRPAVDAAAVDRIFGRLTSSIAASTTLPAASAPGDVEHASGLGSAPLTAPVAPSALSAKVGGIVLAAFVAGIGVGAIGQATFASAPPSNATSAAMPTTTGAMPSANSSSAVDRNVEVGVGKAREGAIRDLPSAVVTSPASPAVRASSSASRGASVTADKDLILARERAWIDQARAAAARGSTADALEALESHAREFPSGRMTEEREALAIHVLATAGRVSEAHERGRAFRARWPSSVLLPIVDQALSRERE